MLPIGSVLRGKFRIDRVLGKGGMAVVYATTHRNSKRFAIKVLHAELSTRPEVNKRFVREGYLANSVEHPGVVAVLDDDVAENGSPFLVMELLEGTSVEALARAERRLSPRAALAITDQLLDVLITAHGRGVIHRDIKPSNLFLCKNGRLKVLDFGIARLRDATRGPSSTSTGAVLGTPAFMAPEQALALSDATDARTDIWGVGASVFTLLSGQQVHPGENPQQVVVRAATEPARSLAAALEGAPGALVALVDKALAFEQGARWGSAQAMQDALRAAHEELYGTRELESLTAWVGERSAESIESAPTEPSPSEEQRTLPPRSQKGTRAPTRRRGLFVFIALAVLGLFGVWQSLGGSPAANEVKSHRPRPSAARPLALAPSSPASQRLPHRPPPATDRSVPTAAPARPGPTARKSEASAPHPPKRNPLDLEIQ